MLSFRKTAIVGLLGLAAFATTPARADLFLYVDGTGVQNTSGCGVPVNCNTHINYAGAADNWNFQIDAKGFDELHNGKLLDIGTIDATTAVGGTVHFDLVETNLTGAAVVNFLMQFVSIQSNMDLKTSFYFDSTNSSTPNLTNLIGTYDTGNHSGIFTNSQLKQIAGLTGLYSLTVDLVLSTTGEATLSSDASISNVPEPAALSLFGLGLLALGGMAWRRRNNKNSVI